MPNLLRVFALTIACLLAISNSIAAQFRDISVSVTPPAAGQTHHGYAVYDVYLENTGTNDRNVQIAVANSWVQGLTLTRVSRTVQVPAGQIVKTSLYQPPATMGSGLQLTVDGARMRSLVAFSAADHSAAQQTYRYSGQGTLGLSLVSTRLSASERDALTRLSDDYQASHTTGTYGSHIENILQFEPHSSGGVQNWPTDWLAYTRYQTVILKQADLISIPADVRTALIAWANAGGHIVALAPLDVTKRVFSDAAWANLSAAEAGESFLPSSTSARGQLGFGQVLSADPASFTGDTFYNAIDNYHKAIERRSGSPQAITSENAERQMQIGPDQPVPVRPLVVVMVCFGLLVGPVNFFLLARMKRRILMYITVPALGVLFSICVFAFGILQGGISPTAATASVTILDQTTATAVTRGQRAYFAPLTPSDGLFFSYDTQIRLLGEQTDWYRDSPRALSLDLTDGQHLTSGWIRPRTPEHFLLTRHEQRRERLTFTKADDGAVTVVNSIGTPLTNLVYADSAGNIYTAARVAQGEGVKMTHVQNEASSDSPSKNKANYETLTRSEALRRLRPQGEYGAARLAARTNNSPLGWVPANGYWAMMEAGVFLEDGLSGLRSHKQSALLVGFVGKGD